MKRYWILIIFFNKSISIKVTEQIVVNPIIVFISNFRFQKNEVSKIGNHELTSVVINK